MKKEFVVKQSGDLIKAILEIEPQLNFNILKTILRKKDVKVNGKRTSKTQDVFCGDKVEIYLPEKKQIVVSKVYEDENILVCVKPQGMEVSLKDKTFTNSACLEELTGFTACHRIDKNTEGLVILAKTKNALNSMIDGFKTGGIKKFYKVVVVGNPKKESENLVAYLKKDEKNSIVKIFDTKVDGSTEIKTNYSLIKSNGNLSLLEVELLTGKTHQIRAHLSHIGLKVLGDEKYGNKQANKEYKVKKQQLCAYKLMFDFNSSNVFSYLNGKTFEITPSFNLENFN